MILSAEVTPERLSSSPVVKETETTKRVTYFGHVLVAEDDRINQKVIQHILEKRGLSVTVVANGQQALEELDTADYDLVLMDIQMPIMNGYEATQQIRCRHSNLPVIALTAHAMKEDRGRCLQAGCNDYLTKPINTDELCAVLQQHLQSPAKTSV